MFHIETVNINMTYTTKSGACFADEFMILASY